MNEEDSIEPILPIHKDESLYSNTAERLLAQGINLSDNLVLHEPTCPICSSNIRKDLESIYEKNENIQEVAEYYKEKTSRAINKNVLLNHMKFHFNNEISEMQKIEYKDKIKRYSEQHLSTLDRIAISFAILTERLMGVNSIVPSAEEGHAYIEKVKSTETSRLMGQIKDLLKLQASILGEMKNNGEVLTIPTNDFIRIMNEALNEAQTESERNLVKNILKKLDEISRKSQ